VLPDVALQGEHPDDGSIGNGGHPHQATAAAPEPLLPR